MDIKDIIGLVIGLAILGNSSFNTWQNNKLKLEVQNLKTLSVYNKAIMDGNTTKQTEYKKLSDEIERVYNAEVKELNSTAIGDTIIF